MNVKLLAHTQLSDTFAHELFLADSHFMVAEDCDASDGQAVALMAIRTCYSANKPSEIVAKEGGKYFGNTATDGKAGSEADRLFRMIFKSKHLSTMEHLTFTFAIEGVSRALLAQLTRHRVGFSFSVQSQRYVRLGSGDKSGGFEYVTPDKIEQTGKSDIHTQGYGFKDTRTAQDLYDDAMTAAQKAYDALRELGIPPEDARAVLPNAAATNLVMTANLRALLDFYAKRRQGRGAQHEITELAEALRKAVTDVEPWTNQFFEEA